MMIAIGIPSYNEADNIAKLVHAIDNAAIRLGVNIVIINADNNSPDHTSEVFQATESRAQKVPLVTALQGKGRNIKAIIEYVSRNTDITYCLFIDGDITSFETDWLTKHIGAGASGADYAIPNYARNMQEGNTTNHFIYPLLFSLTGGRAPYQGIAGDFGVSARFAKYLTEQWWPDSSLGYGIDIFMTMHALFSSIQVLEIPLKQKLHKPSFDKMVGMFQQVAESYYDTRNQLSSETSCTFSRQQDSWLLLLPGKSLPPEKLEQRRQLAHDLHEDNVVNGFDIANLTMIDTMNKEDWVNILALHEKKRLEYTPAQLARSLTPYFLLRVVTYLQTNLEPASAIDEISETATLLMHKLRSTPSLQRRPMKK